MTLGQFFESCSANGILVRNIFIALPILAGFASYFGKDESHKYPWPYFYSALIYAVCIPGIFAVTLNIYLFLFERRSIMNANVYTQILPILSMIFTLFFVKKNVDIRTVPGFDKIGQLIFVLTVLISLLWILEKTNIVVFTYLPFYQFLLMFIGALILIRFGLKNLFG